MALGRVNSATTPSRSTWRISRYTAVARSTESSACTGVSAAASSSSSFPIAEVDVPVGDLTNGVHVSTTGAFMPL